MSASLAPTHRSETLPFQQSVLTMSRPTGNGCSLALSARSTFRVQVAWRASSRTSDHLDDSPALVSLARKRRDMLSQSGEWQQVVPLILRIRYLGHWSHSLLCRGAGDKMSGAFIRNVDYVSLLPLVFRNSPRCTTNLRPIQSPM